MVKRTIQLLTFVFVAYTINAQNIWEDTNITQVNAEKAHASYIPFTKPAWENNNLDSSEQVKMLNGEWKFRYFQNPELVPNNISTEAIEQPETQRVQHRQEGGVGIAGDGLAQRQRAVGGELRHQPVGQRPDALVILLIGICNGIGMRRRGVVRSSRSADGPWRRLDVLRLGGILVFGRRHRRLVLGAHVAALDA